MARCSNCHAEFEGTRQPECPECGAPRPRPRLRIEAALAAEAVNKLTEQVAVAVAMERPSIRRLPTPSVVPADPLNRPAPPPPPPPKVDLQHVEVEYVFAGDGPMLVTATAPVVAEKKEKNEDVEPDDHVAVNNRGARVGLALGMLKLRERFRRS